MIFKEKQSLNPERICLTGFYVPCNGSYTLPAAHSVQCTATVGACSTNHLLALLLVKYGEEVNACFYLHP